jgi:hypothetical protein
LANGKVIKGKGIRLSDLMAAEKTISIDYNGYEVEFTFRVAFWTKESQEKYLEEDKLIAVSNAELIADHVASWNITDEEGDPAPINVNTLEELDIYLLDAMVTAMFDAVRPNPTNSQS